MSQAGTLNITKAHPKIPTQFDADVGSAIPVSNVLEVLGVNGIATSGAGNTLTIGGVNATAAATVGAAQIGVAAFDNDHFTVTSGFVQLSGGGQAVDSITGGVGGAVSPDSQGDIDITGSGGLTVTGSPGTNSLVIAPTGGGSLLSSLTGDIGGPINPDGAGDIDQTGGTNINTAGAANAITYNLDAAISLATSVTSPLYTVGAGTDLDIESVAGKDILIKMGDNAAANKISFTDSDDAEVANLDSNGGIDATSINFGQDDLNNYDEGTFTPVLEFGGASVGITYGIQTANYTRVGNIVICHINIVLTNKGSSNGAATITGFPFTVTKGAGAVIGFLTNFDIVVGYNYVSFQIVATGSTITMEESGDNNGRHITDDSNFNNDTQIAGLFSAIL